MLSHVMPRTSMSQLYFTNWYCHTETAAVPILVAAIERRLQQWCDNITHLVIQSARDSSMVLQLNRFILSSDENLSDYRSVVCSCSNKATLYTLTDCVCSYGQ